MKERERERYNENTRKRRFKQRKKEIEKTSMTLQSIHRNCPCSRSFPINSQYTGWDREIEL